jgi:hypothetical protein
MSFVCIFVAIYSKFFQAPPRLFEFASAQILSKAT